MTIEPVRTEVADLFAPGAPVRFDPEKGRATLAAVSYTAAKRDPSEDLAELARAAAERAAAALYGGRGIRDPRVVLFVADGPWQPDTAVIRHKKLRKRRPDLAEQPGFAALGEEIEIRGAGGVRYGALVAIQREGFERAAEIVRTDRAAAILAGEGLTASTIFSAAFPLVRGEPSTSIDWQSLATRLCPEGVVVARVSGAFDDPAAAVDLVVDPRVHRLGDL
jgi:hypothetical protein